MPREARRQGSIDASPTLRQKGRAGSHSGSEKKKFSRHRLNKTVSQLPEPFRIRCFGNHRPRRAK